jgi:drug/metabolite transporter (DMT)-like permease
MVAIVYAPFALTSLPHHWPRATVTSSVLVLGVVCTAAAFLIFFALIAEVGPVLSTVITYVNPAVAVVLGAAFLHEHIGASTLVGFALILAGSFLATRPARLAGATEPELIATGLVTPEP